MVIFFCISLFLAVYPDPNLPFNVTIVSVTSYLFHFCFILVQIVFILPQILSRWPGYYVFVITTTLSDRRSLLRELGSLYLSSRITTIIYTLDSSSFPINKLRNLGIRNIQTTHFMMLDMDLVLSRMFVILFSI